MRYKIFIIRKIAGLSGSPPATFILNRSQSAHKFFFFLLLFEKKKCLPSGSTDNKTSMWHLRWRIRWAGKSIHCVPKSIVRLISIKTFPNSKAQVFLQTFDRNRLRIKILFPLQTIKEEKKMKKRRGKKKRFSQVHISIISCLYVSIS